jgi:phosphoserine phosphatase
MEDNFDKRYISVSWIITKYKESWYKVIVISWSMDEIVLKFVNYMNFDSWIGTVEFKWKEFLTWKRIVLAKNSTKKLVIDYILKKIKPEHTIWLWDTIGDLWLLRSVNYWIAVNPSRELYHEIKDDSNIKVLIERKDLSFFAEKIDLNFLDNLVL